MPGAYTTVAGVGVARLVVQGSRFVGRVQSATDEPSAEAFVESVRTEDPEATHHVPAYRVRVDGEGRLREYHSDAGEPSGSAGAPALHVLAGQDLENVVVVVTRYYGGTNLGYGGLVRAYTDAVTAAIDDAGTVTHEPRTTVVIGVEYDDSGTVRSILESADLGFEAEYDESVTFTVAVPDRILESVLDRVRSGTSGRATIDG